MKIDPLDLRQATQLLIDQRRPHPPRLNWSWLETKYGVEIAERIKRKALSRAKRIVNYGGELA